MFVLRCTRKLLTRLGEPPADVAPGLSTTTLGDWYADTIPESLPIYGTPAFLAHVIRITTGDALGKVPAETAIAILSHELSHILLHSLRHHDRDSEQCTDLVPIALGFAGIVRAGRVVTTSTTAGNVTTTLTTKCGAAQHDPFHRGGCGAR